MQRTLTLSTLIGLLILFASSLGAPEPGVAPTDPKTPEEEQKTFRLPPGFEVQLVAAEPMIHKPMNLAFDDRGRLWVTDSVEYPYAAPADRKGRDTVKILEDTDGDGKADKATTFADGLNIPIGLMPLPLVKNPAKEGQGYEHAAGLIYSIPNVYRMRDTDGDDKADVREVLYGSFGFRDTHGMCSSFTWGFDGWLYACHGFANTSTLQAKDGSSITMQSGNTWRLRPDGSRVEQFTWGQVNPFGMCIDQLGNLYTADCHSQPVTMLLRGGYYQSFGKPHDGLGFAPDTCQHDHGSTGIAGIASYAADQFPPEYRDCLFTGNVMTNRVHRDRLERQGSSFKTVLQPDFLVSSDPWFRPVDVKLGPDGALYVADFYNRIIGHYEVRLDHPGRDRERGRIWRIIYKGPDGSKPVPPRKDWSLATVEELVKDLGHPNMTVRLKAANQLVVRGGNDNKEAVRRAMEGTDGNAFLRAHGLWVVEQLGGADDELLAKAAQDPVREVRVQAMRVLAERKSLAARTEGLANAGLKDSDPFVQRAAADAISTHELTGSIRPLLEQLQKEPAGDVQLRHMLRISLRNQLREGSALKVLEANALSEPEGQTVADLLLGVPNADAAGFLATQLTRLGDNRDLVGRCVNHVARHGSEGSVDKLLAFVQGHRPDDLGWQQVLLQAAEQGTKARGKSLPSAARPWAEKVTKRLLDAKDDGSLIAGAQLAGSLKIEGTQPALTNICMQRDRGDRPRLAALQALVDTEQKQAIEVMLRLLSDSTQPIPLQEQVTVLLASLNNAEARAALLKLLSASPARIQNAIAAGLAGNPQGAEELLQAVATGKASARLLQERAVQVRLQQSKIAKLDERVAQLTKGLPPADQKLAQLLQQRRSGFQAAKADVQVGAQLYEKHCAACHQLGNKGAKVGPQLDGIGIRGVERLLEDILDPNRNVDQAFRATSLLTKDGQLLTGLVLREEGEVIVFADAQGKEARIEKGTVDQRKTTGLSAMPANLVDQVPENDFYHLIAYLLAQRPKE